MKRLKSANKSKGCIIHVRDPETNETTYWFRVYDYNAYNKMNGGGSIPFVDYEILHHDVFVQIDDDTTAFYEHEGRFYLDHDMEEENGNGND